MPWIKVSKYYLVENRFYLKRLRSKLQKLRIAIFGQFWLKSAFFSIFDPHVFRQSLHTKFLWISWSHWYVLNQKRNWNSKKNRDPKLAIFEFTWFNIGFWNLQIFELSFYQKFPHNFAIEKYQWLQKIQEIFGEKKLRKVLHNTLKIRHWCKINRNCLKWTNNICVYFLKSQWDFTT